MLVSGSRCLWKRNEARRRMMCGERKYNSSLLTITEGKGEIVYLVTSSYKMPDCVQISMD